MDFIKPGSTLEESITQIVIALLWFVRIGIYISIVFVLPIAYSYFEKWAKKKRKIGAVIYEKDIKDPEIKDDKVNRRVDEQLANDEDTNIVSLNDKYSVQQLKMYAKDLGINNYQAMKKAELCSKIVALFDDRENEIELIYALDHGTTKGIAKQMSLKLSGQTQELQDRIVQRRDELFQELDLKSSEPEEVDNEEVENDTESVNE